MAVAQSISTQVKRVNQSALGTIGSTGSQLMRRTSLTMNLQNDTYSSNEIVSHQQSTGAIQGPGRVAGTLATELSPGSNAPEMAVLLRRDFTAVTAITAVALTIAASGSLWTVTRGTGSYLTDGIKVGYVVRLTVGALNAANISKNLLVVGVTATVITVTPMNGVALVAEGPITGCTVSVPGKVTWTPTTGHTNLYQTWEKWFPDVPASEVFGDVKPANAQVTLPATGIPTVSYDMVGLSRADNATEQLTSPTAASTTNVIQAVLGRVVVNGAVTAVTNVQLTVDGATSTGDPEVGSATLSDLQRGKISVSGSFSAKFSATTLQALRRSQTAIALIVGGADSGLAAAEFWVCTLPAIKLMSDDASDDADQQVVRTYNFTAQFNGTGGAGTATNQTIVQLNDSQAP
jgi:hypothetical protein